MKRLLFVLGLFIFIQSQILSQSANLTLSGVVLDNTEKEKIEYASIRILAASDSAYVAGGSTNKNGQFSISLKPAKYIVRISYLGYEDHTVDVNLSKNTSLGEILMKEDAVMLGEAVVETNAIEIMVKGDTVEYNADSYKVQESAVVEDLLKKMPGVEIDADGKITINGKEIKKIMVDGKEFFSDDPKVASKNLPAKMVEKLQVLDQKSDMSLMTGFDDGNEETVINLTVKKGMKEGIFGNGLAGYGSEDKYEGATNVNYMRNNTQVSLIGGINNTNNAGSSDLASAMFSGGGGGRGPRGLRFGGQNGVTKSITGGLNFATEHSDKLKWGGDIRYGNNDNNVISNSSTEYTTSDPLKKSTETSNSRGNNKSQFFATNLKFEWTPDDVTKIIFRPNVQYNTSDNIQKSDGETIFPENQINNYASLGEYYSEGKGYKLNGNLDFSRKLSDAGRVISVGLSGGLNSSEDNGFDYNKIEYASAKADSIIDQQFFQDNDSHNWRVFTSYVEPLKNNNFLELSYNISNSFSETDKNSYYNKNLDRLNPDYSELDTKYTRNVENDFLNQNISLKFKSQREKFNYTLGVGLEPSSSKTTVITPLENPNRIKKSFLSFAPSGQFNYFWDKRHNLRIDYKGTTNQPSTTQLGVTSQNGMNITTGNPDLKASFQNRLNLRYQNFNAERASFMMLMGRFTHTSNDIVSITTRQIDGGQKTTYANIGGNMGGNLRFIINTPLRNRNWSINSMSNVAYDIKNTYIDANKNKAKTLTLHENVGLQFRSDLIDFALRGNIQYNNMKNSISKNNNRNTFNYGGVYDFTLRLPNPMKGVTFFEHVLSDLTIESDINYTTNSGYSAGYKQNEWLWNASIAKQVFKNKAGTIRFKVYDILEQKSNISRTYGNDRITDTITNSLTSYCMVHFVYRFQIFKGGAKQADMEGMGGGRRGPGMGHGRPH